METNKLAAEATVSVTRPNNTTAYTAGDVVGAADTVTPANAGSAIWTFPNIPSKAVIDGVSLRIDTGTATAGVGAFRLHLYSASPTAILDNASWDLPAGDRAAYLGFIDVTTVDLGSTLWGQTDTPNKRVYSTGGTLYGLLVTTPGYTPVASTVATLRLNVRTV